MMFLKFFSMFFGHFVIFAIIFGDFLYFYFFTHSSE
jgi:hypothetical protein